MPTRQDVAHASSRIRLIAAILALVFGAQLTVALGIFMLLPHVPLVLLAVVDAAALALLVTPGLWPLTRRGPASELVPRATAEDAWDRAGDAIITIDEQGVIQSANAAAEAIFGHPASGLVGVDVTKILLQSPDREQPDARDPRSLRAGGRPVVDRRRDVIGRRADGVTFPAELTVREVPAGGRLFLTAIIRDMSGRRAVEDAPRASEESYRRLFDGHPAPLLVYDPASLRFLAVNEAAVRQYGYTREELLAMTLSELGLPEDISILVEHFRKATVDGVRRGTFRHRRKDGSVVHVDVTSQPVDFGGRPARLAHVLDVSQREQPES